MPNPFHENGCWKMRWPRSPAKKQRIRSLGDDGAEEPQFCDAEILLPRRRPHDRTVAPKAASHASLARSNRPAGVGQPLVLQAGPHGPEDLPQPLALPCAETVLPPHAGYCGIGFDTVNAPWVDHMFPFGNEELRRELRDAGVFRGRTHHGTQQPAVGHVRLSAGRECHQLPRGCLKGRNGDALAPTRSIPEQEVEFWSTAPRPAVSRRW